MSHLVDNLLEVSNEDEVLALFLSFVGNLEVHLVLLVNVSLCDVHVGVDDRVALEDVVVGSISVFMCL